MDIELRNDTLGAVVSTAGGCLLRFDWLDGAVPLMRPFEGRPDDFDPVRAAAFPLIPFGNRLRRQCFDIDGRRLRFEPNRPSPAPYLHGDAWLGDWRIVAATADTVCMAYEHRPDDRSPYAYEARQEISLAGRSLCLRMAVTNLGSGAWPFGIGHHPYFPWRDEAQIRLGRAEGLWAEGFDYLPDRLVDAPGDLVFSDFSEPPRRRINNVYENWDGIAAIRWPGRNIGLEIEAGPAFRWLMLFVNTPERDPDYRFDYFCLEPMTHRPGGIEDPGNAGYAVLAPGGSLQSTIRYCAVVSE